MQVVNGLGLGLKKTMFSIRSDIQKWCADAEFFFFLQFFLGEGFADTLGQMEQHTAMHTKGVLD